MKINNNDIVLMLHWEKEKRFSQISYALNNNYGIEIVGFSWSPLYNDNYLMKKMKKEYKNEIKNIFNFISFHGPISDIIPHSDDKSIKNIAKDRICRSIETALELNSKRIIFHTGINHIITDPKYYNNCINEQSKFWIDILTKYKNIEICIENMWEPNPGIMVEILKNCNNEKLNLCFDTGHQNVYGKINFDEWFDKSKNYITHFHLNDNLSIWDEHLTLGKGNYDWKLFIKNIKNNINKQKFVLELDSIEKQIESIKYLKDLDFFE